MATSESKRLVEFGRRADLDLVENHEYTAAHWGERQAEQYTQFLLDTAQGVADAEVFSRPLDGSTTARVAFAKWPKARYGHYIVFRPNDEGIFVLRVLHSAMDIARHLE